MWFSLCENALEQKYMFSNVHALAAAADFMFQSSHDKKVTKKSIAENYSVSVATLSKYIQELLQFLPYSKE